MADRSINLPHCITIGLLCSFPAQATAERMPIRDRKEIKHPPDLNQNNNFRSFGEIENKDGPQNSQSSMKLSED